jgi:glyoxylase-like metal-dependent hydrolase (beta-lactamase superfamily II)
VTKPHIQNWRQALLALQRDYAERDPVVYPGHGEPTDVGLFAEMIRYIDDFTRVVASATVREQAMDEMTRLYPNYAEADFLLRNSVDFHVPENQASAM